jgi:hypothetical protein
VTELADRPSDASVRRAIEFAVSLAAAGVDLPDATNSLRAYRHRASLSKPQLKTLRRLLESDDALRAAVAQRADPGLVDEIGLAWLHAAHPAEELRPQRTVRTRRTAPVSAAEQSSERVSALADMVASLRRELDDRTRTVARLERRVRAALTAATDAAAHNDELQRELDETRRARDRLLARLAVTEQPSAFVAAAESGGATRLRRERRRPIGIPGGLAPDSNAAVTHVLTTAGAVLLVDGYNIAKAGWPRLSLRHQRDALVAFSDDVCRRLGVVISVVFDGTERIQRPTVPTVSRVLFTADDETADDRIRSLVVELDQATPVVVVTSDRQLADDVRRRGATVVASEWMLALRR